MLGLDLVSAEKNKLNYKYQNSNTKLDMMKRIIVLLTFSLALFLVSSSTMAQEKKAKKDKKIETLTCWASMDCDGCVAKIKKNISFEKGVKDLNVDLKTKLVTVKYRKDKTSPEKLEKAIRDLGFKTEIVKNVKDVKQIKKEDKKLK